MARRDMAAPPSRGGGMQRCVRRAIRRRRRDGFGAGIVRAWATRHVAGGETAWHARSTRRRCVGCSSTRRASTRCRAASCATSATRSCCSTRSSRSRSGTASRPSAGRRIPTAFDRRLAEVLVLFTSLGRQPHIWPAPVHDAPADLVARLEAQRVPRRGRGLRHGPDRPGARPRRGRAGYGPDGHASSGSARLARRAGRRSPPTSSPSCCDAFGVEDERRPGVEAETVASLGQRGVHALPRSGSTASRPRSRGGRRSTARATSRRSGRRPGRAGEASASW